MNWDAIGAIAELMAATGALAALVYLALQLKHNTEALRKSELAARSSTSFQGAHSWAELNTHILTPEFATLTARSMEGPLPSISIEESARLGFLGRSALERLDALHYLYRHEQLEEELWNVRVTWARRFLDRPFWREWWQLERQSSNYSPSFIADLESKPSDGGPV